MWVEASAQAPETDSVQASLTDPGYKANQGGQPILAHLGGCWEPEQAPGLEVESVLGLELESELLSVGAGTEFRASRAGMTALSLEAKPELELALWL